MPGASAVTEWRTDGSDRGLRVVLDAAADLARSVDSGEAHDEVRGHVDPGTDAGGGHEVTRAFLAQANRHLSSTG